MRWNIVAGAVAAALTAVIVHPAAKAATMEDRNICIGDQLSDTAGLLGACTAYIEAPPTHPEDLYAALIRRSIAWDLKGDNDLAMKDLDEAVRIKPANLAAYVNRGNHWAYRGEYDKALADLDAALRINPYVSFALVSRGRVWKRKGDDVRALADFDRAIHVETRFPPALIEAGLMRAILNRELDRALDECNRAVTLAKDDSAQAYGARAFVHFRQGDNAAAIADADKAVSLNGKLADPLFIRGQAKARAGQPADGQADLKSAEALDSRIAERFAAWGVKP